MTEVLLAMQMGFPFWVSNFANSYLSRYGLKLAISIDFAGQTVQRMVGKYQLYNVLSQAIELRHAPFFGWIHDLASADPYYITPILLGVGMFVQQKLTPNPSMDKNQEKIMMMMPVIFTVMMLSLPAGMVLYMIANTAVSIAQQQWLNRRLDKQFG